MYSLVTRSTVLHLVEHCFSKPLACPEDLNLVWMAPVVFVYLRFKSGPSSVMPEWKSVRLGRTWNRIHRSLVSIAKSGPRVHLRSGLLRVEESYSPALADDDLDGCHYVISCQLRGCNIQLLSTVLGESFHRMSNFCLFPARRTSYFSTARTKQSRSCLFSSFNCTVLLFVGPSSASPVSTLRPSACSSNSSRAFLSGRPCSKNP